MDVLDKLLEIRQKTHGSFREHAAITQSIKCAMYISTGWDHLSPAQKEALEMSAHKIGRILAGDPNVIDHWFDAAGYMMLVAKILGGDEDE